MAKPKKGLVNRRGFWARPLARLRAPRHWSRTFRAWRPNAEPRKPASLARDQPLPGARQRRVKNGSPETRATFDRQRRRARSRVPDRI